MMAFGVAGGLCAASKVIVAAIWLTGAPGVAAEEEIEVDSNDVGNGVEIADVVEEGVVEVPAGREAKFLYGRRRKTR